jgi:hypothetical protein
MHYMQNIDIGHVVADGVLQQPYSLDTPLAHVDLEDVAEVAAAVVRFPGTMSRRLRVPSRALGLFCSSSADRCRFLVALTALHARVKKCLPEFLQASAGR